MSTEFNPIGWCHFTFNPWWGCHKVGPACKFCYAENIAQHYHGPQYWGKDAQRRPIQESTWKKPFAYDRKAKKMGQKLFVFCASMADIFEGPESCTNPEAYAVIQAARKRLFEEVIPNTPNLIWLLLTKRPEHVLDMVPDSWTGYATLLPDGGADKWIEGEWPENVWVGTTAENQEEANKRVPHLLAVPSPIRFLSCEPLLGPINLRYVVENNECAMDVLNGGFWDEEGLLESEFDDACAGKVDWVIIGGESGTQARPMHPLWAQELVRQCREADVPVWFKQWGTYMPLSEPAVKEQVGKASLKTIEAMTKTQVSMSHAGQIVNMVKHDKLIDPKTLAGQTLNERPTP